MNTPCHVVHSPASHDRVVEILDVWSGITYDRQEADLQNQGNLGMFHPMIPEVLSGLGA